MRCECRWDWSQADGPRCARLLDEVRMQDCGNICVVKTRCARPLDEVRMQGGH